MVKKLLRWKRQLWVCAGLLMHCRTECVFCIPLERNIAARNCNGLLLWRCWFGISGIVHMCYADSMHAGVDQQPLPTAIGGCCGGGAIANNEASSAAAGIGTCASQSARPALSDGVSDGWKQWWLSGILDTVS